ncbi:unnamed protein product [Acanthosepion pharaonis]|uniref:Uncharacterized protein n=1 Tax=Acanthosepion pharaonis TaxID=158019 RepID=A0A812ENU0_ACAPH|nr:unnamed protein product [Sepia pharaonis]
MTQAVIPILAQNNIKAVSVGVNGVSSPPAVPKLFNWVFKNQSVIGFWHPGGYPNVPGQIPIMPLGLSRHDCLVHPLVSSALCFAFKTDNAGPPETLQEILNYYEVVRSQFPQSFVRGSTFDNFVSDVIPIKSRLPKLFNGFVFYFTEQNFQNCEISWQEQRKFIELSLSALANHPLASEIKDKWNGLKTQWPDTSDFDAFNEIYPYSNAFFLGIGKPNMTKNSEALSQVWDSKVVGFYRKSDNASFLIHWQMQDPVTHDYYGAPTDIWINYTQTQKNDWNIELQWFNKSATRLPESMALVMLNPDKTRFKTCVHKMGQVLASDNVLINGSQTLHGKCPCLTY